MNLAIEVEKHGILPTESRGELYRPNPLQLVAGGISHGSRISLVNLTYLNEWGFSSIFIYPITYSINSQNIYSLDCAFSEAQPIRTTRNFRDLVVERLNDLFLKEIGSEVPMTSQNYRGNLNVFHHGFPRELESFLQTTIRKLKTD
ncbi:MAG: hypothetical protein Q8Q31_02260 [Nanoarchaeota archaeon]|nr:hypothetical protein [Nanoarchaeota archaeon]